MLGVPVGAPILLIDRRRHLAAGAQGGVAGQPRALQRRPGLCGDAEDSGNRRASPPVRIAFNSATDRWESMLCAGSRRRWAVAPSTISLMTSVQLGRIQGQQLRRQFTVLGEAMEGAGQPNHKPPVQLNPPEAVGVDEDGVTS